MDRKLSETIEKRFREIGWGSPAEAAGLVAMGKLLSLPQKAMLEIEGTEVEYTDPEEELYLLTAGIFCMYVYKNAKRFAYSPQKCPLPRGLGQYIVKECRTPIYCRNTDGSGIYIKDGEKFIDWVHGISNKEIPDRYFIYDSEGRYCCVTYKKLLSSYGKMKHSLWFFGWTGQIHPFSYYLTRFCNRTHPLTAVNLVNRMWEGLEACLRSYEGERHERKTKPIFL